MEPRFLPLKRQNNLKQNFWSCNYAQNYWKYISHAFFANFNSDKVLDTLSTFIFKKSIHKYKLAVTMEPKSIKCLYIYRLGHLKHKNIMY